MHTHSTTPTTQQLKTCTKCGESFPATTEFYHADKQQRCGLRPSCKKCRVKYSKTYYESNREKIIEKSAAWFRENPERAAARARAWREANRETHAANKKAYQEANRDRITEYHREYHRANQERHSENARAYYQANRERWVEYKHRRRARELNAPGSHTAADIQALYAAQEGRCAYCNQEVGDMYHVDHVVPLSRGGGNGPDNLAIACPPCNSSKQDKLLEEWKGRG